MQSQRTCVTDEEDDKFAQMLSDPAVTVTRLVGFLDQFSLDAITNSMLPRNALVNYKGPHLVEMINYWRRREAEERRAILHNKAKRRAALDNEARELGFAGADDPWFREDERLGWGP